MRAAADHPGVSISIGTPKTVQARPGPSHADRMLAACGRGMDSRFRFGNGVPGGASAGPAGKDARASDRGRAGRGAGGRA